MPLNKKTNPSAQCGPGSNSDEGGQHTIQMYETGASLSDTV